MDTPPSHSQGRPNFMQFRRAEGEQQSIRNENLMNKMAPKYTYYKRDQVPAMSQKQQFNKQMSQMKKQINFLDATKWMFDNNQVLVSQNYSPTPL